MSNRYFLELAYRGDAYAGFQVQENAHSVQGEVERALQIFFRGKISLTGSSRTDAGVHALQNYFHFDYEGEITERSVYNLNAILPMDVAIRSIRRVRENAHCRFDAQYRRYRYRVHTRKNPFVHGLSYYFPYTVDIEKMRHAAAMVCSNEDFELFSKRNTQVKTFRCSIYESEWRRDGDEIHYIVKANRFLRGMVRGLAGTMLQVGRGRMTVEEFGGLLAGRGTMARVDFSVPGHGLWLEEVGFEEGYFG